MQLNEQERFWTLQTWWTRILRNTSGPEADRKRKNIIKIFKERGLSITCEVNKKIIDFLDVRFNLNDQICEPYTKPSNEPVYINKQSNHLPNIIADITKAIFKRLRNISPNKNVFDRNFDIYQTALKNSGFDATITYKDQSEQANNVNIEEANQARKRKHPINCYNPPYSMNVKRNIDKTFFKLLQKHFLPTHLMYTIFNKNKIKISYSGFLNMWSLISSHNKHILNSNSTEYGSNSNNRDEYPLENKCLK